MARLSLLLCSLLAVATPASAQTRRAIMEGLPASSNAIYVDTTNVRVGIGTASPSYRLDVQGDILSTGTVYGKVPSSSVDFSTITAAIALRVAKSGDTMTGNLGMTSSSITFATGGIFNADYLQLNTSYSDGYYPGRFQWDTEHSLPQIGLTASVNGNLFDEMLTYAYNGTASTISNGSVVYQSGVTGGGTGHLPVIGLADAVTNNEPMGVATQDIPAGGWGYVTPYGDVHDINTTYAGATLDAVYLSATPGQFTNVAPSVGRIVRLGTIRYAHATGGVLRVDMQTVPANISATSIRADNFYGEFPRIDLALSTGVYTTNSYSDPSWLTSLSTSKIDLSTVTARFVADESRITALEQGASTAVYTTNSYSNPSWITSLSTSKIDLSTVTSSINAVIASTQPLTRYPNWDTAYSWGPHAGEYLIEPATFTYARPGEVVPSTATGYYPISVASASYATTAGNAVGAAYLSSTQTFTGGNNFSSYAVFSGSDTDIQALDAKDVDVYGPNPDISLLPDSGATPQIAFLTSAGLNNWRIFSGDSESDLTIADSVVGARHVFQQDGDVGIKDTTPIYALDVNGGIRAVSTITADAGFYGSISGTTGNNVTLTEKYDYMRDPTGFPEEGITGSSLTLSGRTFQIAGTNFPVYVNGEKVLESTASIVVPDTTQTSWIYYVSSGTLAYSSSFPGFDQALVASVYYSTRMASGLLGDERHGAYMDWRTHEYVHETIGARYASGMSGTFSATSSTITAGEFYDDDHEIATPQSARFTILYKNGSSLFDFTASTTVVYQQTAGVMQYNNGNALASVGTNQYVAMWVFVTPFVDYPYVIVTGQRVDTTLADARINNTLSGLSLTGFPTAEIKPLYRIILRNAGGTATYIENADYRSVSELPGANYVPTAHSSLTGLELTSASHPYDQAGGFMSYDLATSSYGVINARLNNMDAYHLSTGTAFGGDVSGTYGAIEVDGTKIPNFFASTQTFAGDVTGTYGAMVVGDNSHIHSASTLQNVVSTGTAFAGDVTGTYGATVVGDNSHAHAAISLSGVVVSTWSFSGDVTGAYNATVVGDNSHIHSASTLQNVVSTGTSFGGDVSGTYNAIEVDGTKIPNFFASTQAFAGDVTGTYAAMVVGDDSHIHSASTLQNVVSTGTSFSGDVTGAYNSTVVGNDSHTHGASTLSGVITSTAALQTDINSRVSDTGDTMTGTLHVSSTSIATSSVTINGFANFINGRVGLGVIPTLGVLQIASPDDSVYAAVALRQNNSVTNGWDIKQDTLVNGDLSIQRIVSGTPNDFLTFTGASGYMGVGATAPTAKLVVNGNVVSSGTIYAQSGFYGSGANLSNVVTSTATGTYGISITGNSATATKLATARAINGVSFDGSANINISTTSYLADGTSLNLTGATFSARSSSVTLQGNTFNGASQLVRLDSSGKLPSLDGSQLTGLPSTPGGAVLSSTQTFTGANTFQSSVTLPTRDKVVFGNELHNSSTTITMTAGHEMGTSLKDCIPGSTITITTNGGTIMAMFSGAFGSNTNNATVISGVLVDGDYIDGHSGDVGITEGTVSAATYEANVSYSYLIRNLSAGVHAFCVLGKIYPSGVAVLIGPGGNASYHNYSKPKFSVVELR